MGKEHLMKKRLLSVLLCLGLVTVLVPPAALAEYSTSDTPVAASDVPADPELGDSSANTPPSEGADEPSQDATTVGVTVTAEGITEDIGVTTSQLGAYYQYADGTLTILQDGVTVSGQSTSVALKTADQLTALTAKDLTLRTGTPFTSGTGSLILTLNGSVSLTATDRSAVHCGGSLTLQGGSLRAEGVRYGIDCSGGTLSITDAQVTATASNGTGLSCADTTLTIDDYATVTAAGTDCGLSALRCQVLVSESTLTATGDTNTGLDCSGGALSVLYSSQVTATGSQYGICADAATVLLDKSVVETTATGSADDASGLYCPGEALTVANNTTLTATGTQYGIYAAGSSVTLKTSVTVTATGTEQQGLIGQSLTMLSQGALTASGGTDGICVNGGTVYLEESTVQATGTRHHGFSLNCSNPASAMDTDNTPLTITTGASVTATGGCAGLAANCAANLSGSTVAATGQTWEGIYLAPLEEASSTAETADCHLTITGNSVVQAKGSTNADPDKEHQYAGIYATGAITLHLTRGGSVTAAGSPGAQATPALQSGAAITCGDRTQILTPEQGYIGSYTPSSGRMLHPCYTVLAPAQGSTPATVANAAVFGSIEDGPSYTVTFDTKGGTPVDRQTVFSGDCVQVPNTPDKDGCFFLYWADKTGSTYDFSTPVTADLTLTAVWDDSSAATYTVTFVSNGGSTVDSQTVKLGSQATRPEDPTKSGYLFQYWEQEDGNEYDFDTPVTADLTLMSVWDVPAFPDHTPSPTSYRNHSTPATGASVKTASVTGAATHPETGEERSLLLSIGAMLLAGAGIALLFRRKSE